MNYQDQLTLLSDILKNQHAQNHGTEDEFNQIHRLAESLQAKGELDDQMRQTLASIADYCANRNCTENSGQISQWIQSIEEISVPYPHE
ncbi:hypothetical protein BKP35_17170 [Anaerobacillus arseniciselenatis]|uniref:YtzH-like protein n=1 Tax=Anaerobacillus arseniciselenatis TaxID=85682 RepID=A0A1S2LA94_9BACI|nr:YtzH-like family protein [Anaerobacillus arseniciselenatis]OIJ09266.1 hypothetical protein BKP35_17170 [Anaerobacillus arseniciselenatis]